MTINEFIHELNYSASRVVNDVDDFGDFCNDHDVQWAHGASRLCAIFPKEGKVLKIGRADVMCDYCEREMEFYEKAVALGIADLLLPISLHTILACGVKVYCQPMISFAYEDMDGKIRERLEKKYYNVLHSHVFPKITRSMYWATPQLWTASVVALYGKKYIRTFQKWSDENGVNDLHNGNVGFLHGKPIVLDYGGYYG